jgi:hypothetical protein
MICYPEDMQRFETIDDLRAWLEPMGYEAFWSAIAPYEIFAGGDQAHCDRTIANGIAPYETVVEVLKAMARIALTERYDLTYRSCLPLTPALTVVE